MQYVFDFGAILQGQYAEWLIQGLLTTLALTGTAWALAFSLGTLLAVLRLANIGPLNGLIAGYVAFHRNVPMLVHIMFWYFGVSALLPLALADQINAVGGEFLMAMIAIALVSAAYVAEDLRSALRAIPSGQFEASRALGLSYLQTMRKVMMPQAFRIAIPTLVNQTLLLFKNTSLAMAIGVAELTKAAREIENVTFKVFEAYAAVTVIYLVLSLLIMWAGDALARRNRLSGVR